MSLEHAMFVIIVSALGRFGGFVPVLPALGADDNATDPNHGTTLASELPGPSVWPLMPVAAARGPGRGQVGHHLA